MRPGAAVTINYDMRYDIAGPAHDRPGACRDCGRSSRTGNRNILPVREINNLLMAEQVRVSRTP